MLLLRICRNLLRIWGWVFLILLKSIMLKGFLWIVLVSLLLML